jgi:hypothetical protein
LNVACYLQINGPGDHPLSTSFEEENTHNAALEYWLRRSPEERLQEVERLRHEYMVAISGADSNGVSQRLSRALLVVERGES